MSDLLIPVAYRGLSSWAQHQRRSPRSSEPGTDLYCPIGTPVIAPADGEIWGIGMSIEPATGRWVGVNFDNGQSFRALHLSSLAKTSGRVARGQVIGHSGATGYGENDWSWNPDTGGAHTHVTLWPTHDHRYGYDGNGTPYTIDFMAHAGGGAPAGSEQPNTTKEDDMALRIITGPYYRSAGYQVLHNGIVARSIDANTAGSLRGGGVPHMDYEHDYQFDTELREVWQMAKLTSEVAASAMADEFKERLVG